MATCRDRHVGTHIMHSIEKIELKTHESQEEALNRYSVLPPPQVIPKTLSPLTDVGVSLTALEVLTATPTLSLHLSLI